MINIEFDLDSTLVEIMKPFEKIMLREYGLDVSGSTQYDLADEFDLSFDKIMKGFAEVYDMIEEIEFMPGAEELLHNLYARSDDPVHIITSRPIEFAEHTFRLMERFNVPFTISMLDYHYDKHNYIRKEYFVEDRRRTAIDLANRGIKVFMPKHSYNKLTQTPGCWPENLNPIDSLEELMPYLHLFVK